MVKIKKHAKLTKQKCLIFWPWLYGMQSSHFSSGGLASGETCHAKLWFTVDWRSRLSGRGNTQHGLQWSRKDTLFGHAPSFLQDLPKRPIYCLWEESCIRRRTLWTKSGKHICRKTSFPFASLGCHQAWCSSLHNSSYCRREVGGTTFGEYIG